MGESLVDIAKREADEAEAEAAQPRRRGRPRKTEEKTNGVNGHANGVGYGAATMHPPAGEPPADGESDQEPPTEEASPAQPAAAAAGDPPASAPGEQGSATQDDGGDAEEEAQPFSRPSSAEQVRIANTLLHELKRNVAQLSMGEVVDRLLQIVDVAPAVTAPTAWTHGEDRYAPSDVLETIGSLLLRGCDTLELAPSDVRFMWRNAKNWVKQGQVVVAEAKIVPPWARSLTDGVSVVVHVNFREFIKLNSDQKVKRLYHTLRGLDAEAKRVPPQFHGWTDELEYFGPLTFEEEVSLVNAITRGRRKRFTYQLDLMDEAETAGAAAE